MSALRSALLRGRDLHEIGAIDAVAEGPAAISLSRGGAVKTYAHTDPNEDAALFAIGEAGALVAVADGHEGASAAEVALEHLRDCAEHWTTPAPTEASEDAWCRTAREALVGANAAILARAAKHGEPPSRTTLSFALVRPAEGLALHAAIGDSHVFRVDAAGPVEIGWAADGRRRGYFLGYEDETVDRQREKCVVACGPLAEAEALVLVTDGLSELGIGVADPARAVEQALRASAEEPPAVRPLAACRLIAETAIAAQRANRAGDNVAVALLRLTS